MTKDERLNLWKPKISRKPAHNFMKCCHLSFLHEVVSRYLSVVQNTFINCLRTKLSLYSAYSRA